MPDSFKHRVDLPNMGQPTFSTCWWASYRMVFSFLNRHLNEIDDKLTAAKLDLDDIKQNGLTDMDYMKAASALGLKGWPGTLFSSAPWIDIGLSSGAKDFLTELRIGPLWVSRIAESRPGKQRSNHIVVAVGYDDDEGWIIYNNPFPGPINANEMKLRANVFVRNITAANGSVQGYRSRTGDQ
jgi:Papain-like cysteine protease AvrRpt2